MWLVILFSFNDPLDGRHLVLLDSCFLLLLAFPHRVKVFLVLFSRLGKCFIAAKRLEGHGLELHFLWDSIQLTNKRCIMIAKIENLPLLTSSSAAGAGLPPVTAALDCSDSSIPISFSLLSRSLLADINARGSESASMNPRMSQWYPIHAKGFDIRALEDTYLPIHLERKS